VTHALYFCQQPDGPAGIADMKDCVKQETAAYTASCRRHAQMECAPDPGDPRTIKKCVERGVKEISCNPKTRSDWNPCKTDLPRVFPESGKTAQTS
jgi:hypothetical protein